jgi:hypothetical protein
MDYYENNFSGPNEMYDTREKAKSNYGQSKAIGVASGANLWKHSLVLSLGVAVAAFLLGGLSNRHDIFPWPQISALKGAIFHKAPPPPSRYSFDSLGRLIADESKSRIDCPAQTRRTAVLLTLGQSNAANHGGMRFASQHGAKVVNFFNGQCFLAQSPLLGSTGTKGEYWTQVANLMISSGKFDQVILAPLAVDGSEVSRWGKGGDINARLIDALASLKSHDYKVTKVLWHQGEADYIEGTNQEAYRERLASMIDTLRRHNVGADVFVSVASKCLEPTNGGFKTHSPDNAIVRAQLQMADEMDGVRRGVNTDLLLDEVDRYDDCHIGGSGATKVASAWARLLLADRSQQAENP